MYFADTAQQFSAKFTRSLSPEIVMLSLPHPQLHDEKDRSDLCSTHDPCVCHVVSSAFLKGGVINRHDLFMRISRICVSPPALKDTIQHIHYNISPKHGRGVAMGERGGWGHKLYDDACCGSCSVMLHVDCPTSSCQKVFGGVDVWMNPENHVLKKKYCGQ